MSWDLDKIPKYVINLDRRKDRWNTFQSGPGVQYFPNIRRWPAVDGSKLSIDNDNRISIFTKSNILKKERRSHSQLNTMGAIGCYFSHVAIWKDFLLSSSEVALIFEDDVLLDQMAAERIKRWINGSSVIQDTHMWDFCIITPHKYPINKTLVSQDDPTCINLPQFTGTGAYLINKEGIRKIMPHIFPIEGHIDGFLTIASQLNIIKLCSPYNRLLKLTNSPTDIQDASQCDICNVKPNFSKVAVLVPKGRLLTYKLEEIILVCGLIGLVYLYNKK